MKLSLILKQHYVIPPPPQNNRFKIMLMVQCLVIGCVLSLSQSPFPPSPVSALCNFTERVG